MGNMRRGNEESPRMGSVNSGSPRLVQDDTNMRQSATADLMDDGQFEDVHSDDEGLSKKDKKKKQKKDKKDKKEKKHHHGMGLYHRATANKKGKRTSTHEEYEMADATRPGQGVSQPEAARKKPVRVRYAPIAPSEGMHQHVSGPKQRQRGGGRTAAAAVNPGNWFWMDVYWK
jgi:collagen type V/XI/XXIV/XXVII alpha